MRFVLSAFLCLCPVAIALSCWTFLFPLWANCTFPTKDPQYSPSLGRRALDALLGSDEDRHPRAEFRLLAFGDPQLEGDSSIWHARHDDPYLPGNLWRGLVEAGSLRARLRFLGHASRDGLTRALPSQLKAWRKQLDLLGNDYYLAHVYRSVHRATDPTHVTVLGDLLGSQWVGDDEFEWRAWRYWNRVFRGGELVENSTAGENIKDTLGRDPRWARRVINVAGNHDIGYAGDITTRRLERFELAFGSANYEIAFEHPQKHEASGSNPLLRLVILNSMNLDAPARSAELQRQTYDFINKVIQGSKPVEDRTVGTLLLTHIPLHKEAGVCADGPYFDFRERWDGGGGIKEQNHLSYDASTGAILQGIYGMSGDPHAPAGGFGRPGIVLNGHDHEGCDTYHYLPEADGGGSSSSEDQPRRWNATRIENAAGFMDGSVPGIREVTLRAMMGEFGGFAYLVSAWFDFDAGEWRFGVNRCSAGVQHWWWATQVSMLVVAGLGSLGAVLEIAFPVKSSKDLPSKRAGGGGAAKKRNRKRIT